jgi:hypothetical protein
MDIRQLNGTNLAQDILVEEQWNFVRQLRGFNNGNTARRIIGPVEYHYPGMITDHEGFSANNGGTETLRNHRDHIHYGQ